MIKNMLIQALSCGVLPAGIVFFLNGKLMQRYPPRWPNYWYGFRTPNSLRTKETFDAANTFSAALMVKYGMLMMIGGLLIGMMYIEKYGWWFMGCGALIVIVSAVLLIIKTEKYLATNFNKNGSPL